jgi:hypothetical protein
MGQRQGRKDNTPAANRKLIVPGQYDGGRWYNPAMGNECLPEKLRKRHDDWFWLVSWVQRGWTAKCGSRWPMPPKLLLGDSGWTGADQAEQGHHTAKWLDKYGKVLPIPKAGNWILTAAMYNGWVPVPMFAITWKNGDYYSLGVARWDNVDNYYDLFRVRAHGRRGRMFMYATGLFLAASVFTAIGTAYYLFS